MNMKLKSITISLIFIVTILSSCTHIPRVIVLHDPLSGKEHITLGMSYELKGEYDYAIREYKKAENLLKGDYRPPFYLGNVYYKKGEYERAERSYKKALRLKPDDGDIMNNLAWVYMDTGKLDKARQEIERALHIARKPYYLDTLANIYVRMDRYERALHVVEEALSIIPESNTDLLRVEYLLMGDIYEKLHMPRKAEEARKKAETYTKER